MVFALGSFGFRPGFVWFSPWVPLVFALRLRLRMLLLRLSLLRLRLRRLRLRLLRLLLFAIYRRLRFVKFSMFSGVPEELPGARPGINIF